MILHPIQLKIYELISLTYYLLFLNTASQTLLMSPF